MLDDGNWEEIYEECVASDATELEGSGTVARSAIGRLLGFESPARTGASDYLGGNTIFLFGPAAPADEEPLICRENALIAGLNLRSGALPTSAGQTQVDLCYYSNIHGKLLTEEQGLSAIDIDWLVVKNRRTKVMMAQQGVNARILENPAACFFNADFNLVQLAVSDLLLAGARHVKVLRADLMLSKGRAEGYYPEAIAATYAKDVAFSRSSVVHDPATQYNLLCNLFKRRRITGDQRFNEVMSLGCKRYMSKLQAIYAPSIAGRSQR